MAQESAFPEPVFPHRADWPAPGTKIMKMSEIELPRRSSGTEWWYYNFHLSLVDGQKASAFIAFFRVAGSSARKQSAAESKPTTPDDDDNRDELGDEGEPVHSHFVHFAISLPPQGDQDDGEGRYLFTSAMDRENAALFLSMLESDTVVDPLLRRGLVAILRDGKMPKPDSLIVGEVTVAEQGALDLTYGDTARVVCKGEGDYHITAKSSDGSFGLDLVLVPRKPPVAHGADGVVHGHSKNDNSGMYYCFVSRCDVTGSIRVDNIERGVDASCSSGWYDREMGGEQWNTGKATTFEGSWVWGAVQLSNNWDLTFYLLWDVDVYDNNKKVLRDRRAVAISPAGERFECEEHTLDCRDTWTSMKTLNEYGMKWSLRIPKFDVQLELDAPFKQQEVETMCAVRGYWEGRMNVQGSMLGQNVEGLAFIESVPPQIITKFEKYLKRVNHITSVEVRKIYPDKLLNAQDAIRILGLDSTFTDSSNQFAEMPLDVLHHHLFAPVRHITDSGGKAWRSFLFLACIMIFGKNPEPFRPLLAAIELLHSGSLIIDDIQDGSPVRRGVGSVHGIWGTATAINAGTAAYFAFESAVRAIRNLLTPEQVMKIYDTYFETMRAAHAGQALDIAGQPLDDILDGSVDPRVLEQRVLTVHRLKTAVIAANIAKMAAVIADASPEQTLALTNYFERVGIAFQIIDDVYDIRGWEKSKDKPTLKRRGDDIRSGKISIPIAKASNMPLEEARWVWKTVLSKPGDDDQLTQEVIDKLERYGIVDMCVNEAHGMVEEAWKDLEGHLEDSVEKIHVQTLGWYLVRHNSI